MLSLHRYLKQHTDCEVLYSQDKNPSIPLDLELRHVPPPLTEEELKNQNTSGLLAGTMQATLKGQPRGKMPIYQQGAATSNAASKPGVATKVVLAGSVRYSFSVFWPNKTAAQMKVGFADIIAPNLSNNPLYNPNAPLHGLIARATQQAGRLAYWQEMTPGCRKKIVDRGCVPPAGA